MPYLTVKTEEGADESVRIANFPDRCPICHHSIEPVYLNRSLLRHSALTLQLVFVCPKLTCQSFFIARYNCSRLANYVLDTCVPFEPIQHKFSDHIKTISSRFCDILNESKNAELQGWKLVAGPGYRKALEFLIKDYLCALRPKDADAIKHTQLGTCINNYVTNDSVRTTAERAAWIGNDETHYARRWQDKDLDDLKTLIELTVHWIEMEIMTKKMLGDMPQGKK